MGRESLGKAGRQKKKALGNFIVNYSSNQASKNIPDLGDQSRTSRIRGRFQSQHIRLNVSGLLATTGMQRGTIMLSKLQGDAWRSTRRE